MFTIPSLLSIMFSSYPPEAAAGVAASSLSPVPLSELIYIHLTHSLANKTKSQRVDQEREKRGHKIVQTLFVTINVLRTSFLHK